MRAVVLALAGVLFAATAADAATPTYWKITKDHWDAGDEEGFGRFVQGFADSNCATPEACFESAANPYRMSDPPELVMSGDCADFIYQMRAYYAWKNGLPFSYALYVAPRIDSVADDRRFTENGNMVVARLQMQWQTNVDPVKFLRTVGGTVSTAMFRVGSEFDRGYNASDFYSPKISAASIKPGTIIYDMWGHVVYVSRVDADGTVHYVDSNPDRAVTRGSFGPHFLRSGPRVAAGFQRFRPIRLVGYTKNADGSLSGGRFVMATNAELPDYSLEQYLGTEPNESKDWKAAKFTIGGTEVKFFDYVRLKLAADLAPQTN